MLQYIYLENKINNLQLFQTMSGIVHRRLKIGTIFNCYFWTSDSQCLIILTVLVIDEIEFGLKPFTIYGVIWSENNCKCMWCTEHGWRFIGSAVRPDRFNSIIIFIDNNAIIDFHIISVMAAVHMFQFEWFEWQFNHRSRRSNNYPFAFLVMCIMSFNSILRRWWWDFHVWIFDDSSAS